MNKVLIAVLVVMLFVGVVGVYTLYRGARVKSAQPCWGKLGNLKAAKDQWALETHASPGSSVTVSNILPYLSAMPTCHIAGATYIIGKVGEEPRCTVHGTFSNFRPDHY